MPLKLLDDLGDRLNPVTVLMARQSSSPEIRGIGTLVFCVLVWIAAFFLCVFHTLVEEFVNDMSTTASPNTAHVMPCLMMNLYSLILAFSMISCQVSWRGFLRRDPTLQLTPLSERDMLVGAWRHGMWMPIHLTGLFAPIFVTLHYLRIFSTDGAVFYPLVTCLLGIQYSFLFLPFIAAIRTWLEEMIVFGFGIVSAIGIYAGGGGLVIVLAVTPPGFTSFETLADRRCWLPVLLAATVSSYFLAWRFVDFNLARHRSFSWKLAATLIAYSLWALAMLALWFGLWLML